MKLRSIRERNEPLGDGENGREYRREVATKTKGQDVRPGWSRNAAML